MRKGKRLLLELLFRLTTPLWLPFVALVFLIVYLVDTFTDRKT